MKRNRVIGITGGIATGKSTAVAYLIEKGYLVIDADLLAREVVEPGSAGLAAIVSAFGEEVVADGRLDRKRLGAIIFGDHAKREALNAIVHPLVYTLMKKRIQEAERALVFVDSPLLLEGLEKAKSHGVEFDEIWLVDLDEDQQLARLMERDGFTEEEARQRMSAQWTMAAKRKLVDRIIDNRGGRDELYRQLEEALACVREVAGEE